MFPVDNIRILCREHGISLAELERILRFGNGVIAKWEKSKNSPTIDRLAKIADYFGVSVEELSSVRTSARSLSDNEETILTAYKAASPLDRAIIDNIVSRYAKPATKTIPLFGTAAAAGAGEPDTGLPWEDYEVPESSTADFAVRISGDSMTPHLQDGQIALCKRRKPVVGDIAVVMINGAMLVKQYISDNYGNVYLRSLNRDRKDCDYDIWASGNDTVLCFGVVMMHRIPLVSE